MDCMPLVFIVFAFVGNIEEEALQFSVCPGSPAKVIYTDVKNVKGISLQNRWKRGNFSESVTIDTPCPEEEGAIRGQCKKLVTYKDFGFVNSLIKKIESHNTNVGGYRVERINFDESRFGNLKGTSLNKDSWAIESFINK